MWADLVLVDGNVLTMNSSQPFAEAIAIKKGNTSKESSSGRADRRGDRKRYY